MSKDNHFSLFFRNDFINRTSCPKVFPLNFFSKKLFYPVINGATGRWQGEKAAGCRFQFDFLKSLMAVPFGISPGLQIRGS